jgi:hypothetical protein
MRGAITTRRVSLTLFGVGALFLAYGAWQWWDGERAFARMRATTCTVVRRTIDANMLVSTPPPGRRGFSPGTARIREEAHLELAHTVDGRQHRFSEHFVYDWAEYAKTGYAEGKSYPCRYDPQDPDRGTIRSEFDSRGPIDNLALGLVAVLFGALLPAISREVARYSRR